MFQLFFAAAALVLATIHLGLSPARRSNGAAIAATYLLYLFVIYVGLMGLLTAYAHVFRPLQTSASIGWVTSPYEYEVGMADLTVGVLGVLCVWFRGDFWLATAIANLVWLEGDALGHIRQVVEYKNQAADNAGLFLYLEIMTPLLILFLTLYHRRKTLPAA
jgi:hypothetical protein